MLEKPGIQASQSLTDGTKFKSKEEHQLGYLTTLWSATEYRQQKGNQQNKFEKCF